jgi:SAM-dependent methyltransferase
MTRCPLCERDDPEVFHVVRGVPTNSCLILESETEARNCRRGDVELAFCAGCGFIHNRAFDPRRTEYSERYASTQAHSGTFNTYQTGLAERIGARFDVGDAGIVEVGCGEGDFLAVLSEVLAVPGVGVDPAAPRRASGAGDVRFIAEPLSSELADSLTADVVVCKMTLEHVADLHGFVDLLARIARRRAATGLFVSVPATERILATGAFWDIYYEHCNYFTEISLRHLLQLHGFGELLVERDYGDQYLAAFGQQAVVERGADDAALDELAAAVAGFAESAARGAAAWNEAFAGRRARGETIVLWGSGSKAVGLMSVLDRPEDIAAVVDINPVRQNCYCAGTGHLVVAPEALAALRPDCVVAMNPNYREEIAAALAAIVPDAELLVLT